jgi:GntP family gluconate:H+ symporter
LENEVSIYSKYISAMGSPLLHTLIVLAVGICTIVLLTIRLRIPAFFALLVASLLTGIGLALPVETLLGSMRDGFGNIMKSLGIIIVLGTALGVMLEHTGSTKVMADYILKMTGRRHAGLAMSITGFVVGLPVFCDSGYIVLSGLVHPVSGRTGKPLATIAICLATGLYSVHCLVPPHPGAAAAAGALGVDFGRLILWGSLAALPAMLAGWVWASRAGKGTPTVAESFSENAGPAGPGAFGAFFPVLLPILLIALRSLLLIGQKPPDGLMKILLTLGDPVLALASGLAAVFIFNRTRLRKKFASLLQESVEKAGGILVIIGAGGAFGAVLASARIGEHFSQVAKAGTLGLLFPFALSSLLKTAQGSSTVAIITASSILAPLLPALGLDSENGRLLAVLSLGAGSMIISHSNDAYFWVIARFSGLDIRTMLKGFSLASIGMGLVTLLTLYLFSFILR